MFRGTIRTAVCLFEWGRTSAGPLCMHRQTWCQRPNYGRIRLQKPVRSCVQGIHVACLDRPESGSRVAHEPLQPYAQSRGFVQLAGAPLALARPFKVAQNSPSVGQEGLGVIPATEVPGGAHTGACALDYLDWVFKWTKLACLWCFEAPP